MSLCMGLADAGPIVHPHAKGYLSTWQSSLGAILPKGQVAFEIYVSEKRLPIHRRFSALSTATAPIAHLWYPMTRLGTVSSEWIDRRNGELIVSSACSW